MTYRTYRTHLLFLTALFLGCALGKPEPPKITQDRSACAKCRMLVSDLRYAGAYNDGSEKVFDDIGCMLNLIASQDLKLENVWVMDYQKYAWIEAQHAIFIYAPKLGTPMNYGYVAVADVKAANDLAARVGGQVLGDWNATLHFFKGRV
jgi:nitrous oxide reductase accessory protein NosL